MKNKKIEKRRPTTVVTGAGGAPGDTGVTYKSPSLDCPWRKTTIVYFFHKTDRDCVPFLHFYHAKIVNIDMRRMDVLNTNLDGHERN